MKQSTRRHVQRVAAGILASLLTLSGIGAAHATSSHEPGHGLTEVNVPVSFGYSVEVNGHTYWFGAYSTPPDADNNSDMLNEWQAKQGVHNPLFPYTDEREINFFRDDSRRACAHQKDTLNAQYAPFDTSRYCAPMHTGANEYMNYDGKAGSALTHPMFNTDFTGAHSTHTPVGQEHVPEWKSTQATHPLSEEATAIMMSVFTRVPSADSRAAIAALVAENWGQGGDVQPAISRLYADHPAVKKLANEYAWQASHWTPDTFRTTTGKVVYSGGFIHQGIGVYNGAHLVPGLHATSQLSSTYFDEEVTDARSTVRATVEGAGIDGLPISAPDGEPNAATFHWQADYATCLTAESKVNVGVADLVGVQCHQPPHHIEGSDTTFNVLPDPETTVCFHPQGGSLGSLPVDYLGVHCLILHLGGSVSLLSPVRPGYEFAGWYLNPEGTGKQITDINSATQTDNYGNSKVDLYAQWKNANLSVKVEAQTPLLATEQRMNPIQYELTPQHSDGQAYDATFTLIYEGNNWVEEKRATKHITLSGSAQTIEFTPADFGWDTAPEHYGFQPGTYTYELTVGDFHIPAYSDEQNETVVSPQGMSAPQTREATEEGKTYHVHTNADVASGYYQYTITDTVNTAIPFTVSNYRIQFPQADMTNEFTVTSDSGKVIARWNHEDWEVPAGAITVDYDLTFQKTPDMLLTRTVNVDNGFETVGTQSAFPQPVEVSFNLNGGEGSLPGVEVTPYVPSNVSMFTPPTRDGYQFVGWALTADGDTLSQVTPHAPVTLYAQWKKAIPQTELTPAHKTKRTVTFTSDKPCPASKRETAVDGDQLTTPVFTCDGYQLAGWDIHSHQGVARVEQTPFTFTVKGDMTVMAQWKKSIPMTDLQPAHKTERSVRFHSNDKRDIVVTVHATDGDTVSLKTGLTRDGYVLAGWATTPGSPTLAYPATGRLTVDGDKDLYAVWKPVSTESKPAPQATTPAQQKPSSRPRVVSETSATGELASTGSTVSSIALLAMVLLTVGVGSVLLTRRKQ